MMNWAIQSGSTPLLYACKFGLVSIVKKLLEKQCNVNLRDEVGLFLVG